MADLEQGQVISLEAALRLEPPKEQTMLSPEEAVQLFQEAFRVADEIRPPRERIWKPCYNLYNGQYDWSGKADWQSKINIPRVREAVDKAAATFKRSLLRMKRFYSIESETRLGIQMGQYTKSLIDYWLEHGDVGFIEELVASFKSGLITGVAAMKIWWKWQTIKGPHVADKTVKVPVTDPLTGEQSFITQEYKDLSTANRVKGMLGIKAIDPFNLWRGPRDSYTIERSYVDLAYLKEMVGKGVYDAEAVDKLQGGQTSDTDKVNAQKRAGEGTHTPQGSYIREIPIYHYWGPMYNKEGELLRETITFTVAGEDRSLVIRKPI